MLEDSLIQALPELVAFVRRDGVVLRELGGRRLGLPANGQLTGNGRLRRPQILAQYPMEESADAVL